MRHRQLTAAPGRRFALVFDAGDKVIDELQRFAEAERISGAHFTGLGAFRRATLGYFERARKDYHRISVDSQVEVGAMTGNIAVHDGAAKVHAHVVLGHRDGSSVTGHLLDAEVWPTLELELTESENELRRRMDDTIGLPLLVP